jgi:hypothetical protein
MVDNSSENIVTSDHSPTGTSKGSTSELGIIVAPKAFFCREYLQDYKNTKSDIAKSVFEVLHRANRDTRAHDGCNHQILLRVSFTPQCSPPAFSARGHSACAISTALVRPPLRSKTPPNLPQHSAALLYLPRSSAAPNPSSQSTPASQPNSPKPTQPPSLAARVPSSPSPPPSNPTSPRSPKPPNSAHSSPTAASTPNSGG